MDNAEDRIMDTISKVCICKGITKGTIRKVIQNGTYKLEDVKKITGACSGPCNGTRCTPKIAEMILEHLNELSQKKKEGK